MLREDKITYRYSLVSSLLYAAFFAVPVIWLGIDVVGFFKADDIFGVFFFSLLAALFAVYMAVVIRRYVIPAFRSNVALELNQQGIIYHPKNVIIEWNEITDLRIATNNQGFYTLYCYYEMLNGSSAHLKMSLTWVDCDEKEVYGIIEANLEDRNPNFQANAFKRNT